ncbi:MAG: energy transducer TonB [Muribaculaceae bacterium]|nr:energy transducer TonB [Muribaculaceae bacterium]
MTGLKNYIEVYEYDFVTEKPSFPGGDSKLLSYINSARKYPEEAYKRGIEGKVTCSFVVNRDGSISHVRVLRGVERSLNKEAVRILSKMPLWHPGRLEGEKVPVRVVRSVTFRK